MGPRPNQPHSGDLFRQPLLEQIDRQHPLARMAAHVDWSRIDALGRSVFPASTGRPASSPRLIAGLLYLQRLFALSGEEVVLMWVENPYWQVLCGETCLQIAPPLDSSSLVRWRRRLGESGVAELLAVMDEGAGRAALPRRPALKAVPLWRSGLRQAMRSSRRPPIVSPPREALAASPSGGEAKGDSGRGVAAGRDGSENGNSPQGGLF